MSDIEKFLVSSKLVSSRENSNSCKKCASFLSKCKKYRKIIKHYKRQQEFIMVSRFILFMLSCWLIYKIYQMALDNNLLSKN